MTISRAAIGTNKAPSPARRRALLPALAITGGSLEALKWLGLVLMTLDHVNKYLLHDAVPALYDAGRIVMPLFAFVLAVNLARAGTLASGAYPRVMQRLAVAAVIASVPFIALGGLGWGWWPLNILATFLVATAAMYGFDRGGKANAFLACLTLLVGGAFVEFWWPALAIIMGVWSYARRPSVAALLLGVAGVAALQLINQNAWAWAALPFIAVAIAMPLRVPRLRWVFYVFYPAHLAAIWAIRELGCC
jgi:TraX protein